MPDETSRACAKEEHETCLSYPYEGCGCGCHTGWEPIATKTLEWNRTFDHFHGTPQGIDGAGATEYFPGLDSLIEWATTYILEDICDECADTVRHDLQTAHFVSVVCTNPECDWGELESINARACNNDSCQPDDATLQEVS